MRLIFRRLLPLTLCICMLFPCLANLTACGDGGEGGGTTPVSDAASGNGTEADTGDPSLRSDLPADLRYDGETVRLLCRKTGVSGEEFDVAEPSAVLVENAVYERNRILEDRLGIRQEIIVSSSVTNDHRSDFTAGYTPGESYDIVTAATYAAVSSIPNGYYRDLSAVGTMSLDKRYWCQGYNALFTYTDQNKQYLTTGAMSLTLYRLMFLTLYNRQLFEDRKLPDLYDTVMNGQWTLDEQLRLMEGTYIDDGDGKKNEKDFFGFVSGSVVSVDPYCTASDVHLIVRDRDSGDWYYNADILERFSEMADKTAAVLHGDNSWLYAEDDVGTTDVVMKFAGEGALMCTAMVYSLETCIGEIKFDYGVAPMPKFDAAQPAYGTYVQDQVTGIGISSVIPEDRAEMVGAVLEVMAETSWGTVRNAYYEQALSLRFMNSPQSNQVLDLIYNSLTFDFVACSCGAIGVNPAGDVRSTLSSGRQVGSYFKRAGKTIGKALEQFNQKMRQPGL